MAAVDTRAVAAAQHIRLADLRVDLACHRHAVLAHRGGDDPLNRVAVPGSIGIADLPLGLGANVMDLPDRPRRRHPLDHRAGQPVDGLLVDRRGPDHGVRRGGGDHRVHLAHPAEDFGGLGPPGLALLAQGAWLVLGGARFQGRLL